MIPAVVWTDAVSGARRRQSTAEKHQTNVEAPLWAPPCPETTDLVSALREAARIEAEAFARFAEYAEAAFQSAAEHEMTEADWHSYGGRSPMDGAA